MGVPGSTGYTAASHADLGRRRATIPPAARADILSRYTDLASAVRACKEIGPVPNHDLCKALLHLRLFANTDRPRIVVAIDVYGHFGYLLYRLAHGCIMRSFYMHPAQDSRQMMLQRASTDYKVQFRAAVRELYNIIASVCSQDDILVSSAKSVSLASAELRQ